LTKEKCCDNKSWNIFFYSSST